MLLPDLLIYYPEYVVDNFKALCEKGDVVEPYPQNYEPGLKKGGQYTFCKLLDSEPFKSELAKSTICIKVGQILRDIQVESESVKAALVDKTPYFTGLVLQCVSKEEILQGLESFLGPGPLLVILANYLEELKFGFQQLSVDPGIRKTFLWDICEFYIIISRCVAMQEEKVSYYPLSYDLPCYLPSTVRNRILLLGLLPRKAELKVALERVTPQFNNCCSKFISTELDRYTISPSLFKKLIHSLPRRKIEARLRVQIILPLENLVWKGHLYPFPKYKTTEESYLKRQPNLYRSFDDWQMLAQVICLLQPNWQQLWYMMGWPCPLGIVRRLQFLKLEEKWSPPTQSMVELLAKP